MNIDISTCCSEALLLDEGPPFSAVKATSQVRIEANRCGTGP